MKISRRARAAVAALAVAGWTACQVPPVQRVPLDLEPTDSTVYVDGTRLAAGTRSVELRSDEPHVVLAKRDGYRPQRVVLEPRRDGGVPRLEPSQVKLVLEPVVPTQRAIQIEGAD